MRYQILFLNIKSFGEYEKGSFTFFKFGTVLSINDEFIWQFLWLIITYVNDNQTITIYRRVCNIPNYYTWKLLDIERTMFC